MQSNFIFATLLVLLSLLAFTQASGSGASSSINMLGGTMLVAFAFAIFSRLAQNFAPRAIFSLLPYHSVSC